MKKVLVVSLCVIFMTAASVFANEIEPLAFSHGDGVLKINNSFIEIIVNKSEDGTGRFAVLTTGGDPDRTDDNNNFLIYGLGKPVTSYSTVRIDKKDFVFGGKTTKRAGISGDVGTLVTAPVHREDGIYTAYLYGDVLVEQILNITTSTTTGQPDTASISYVVTNQGESTRNIGVRTMLDTMLGNNDGAPFRARDMAVVSDTMFDGEEIPSFVQAFDDLVRPAVMAQANLSGPEVTKPSRVYFTNWGSVADGIWDFNFQPGRDFTRIGEFDLDSAMALYWDPTPLKPGESKRCITHYGLGGITIAQGYLSLGLSTVNKVEMAVNPVPFDVIGYIQNTGDGIAHEVVADLLLPNGLKHVNEPEKFLDKMAPGESRQVVWKVVPTGEAFGNVRMTMNVEAIDVEPLSVSRDIEISKPARLSLSLSGPRNLGIYEEKLYPEVFEVTGTIENSGDSTAHNVELKLMTSAFKIVSGANPNLFDAYYVGSLQPSEKKEVVWRIDTKPNSMLTYPFGTIDVVLEAESTNAEKPADRKLGIQVPQLKPKLKLIANSVKRIGDINVLVVDVISTNIPALKTFTMQVNFDPSLLRFEGWVLGRDMVKPELPKGQFTVTDTYEANRLGMIEIQGQVVDRGSITTLLAQLKFSILDYVDTTISIGQSSVNPLDSYATDNLEIEYQ
ncbi:MAG: cellulosome anchor protein [Firmicutes bacterium]|nr:cellulosome anchor protein [Bacillota bacterium]